jgi:branched-subunit amino acid ABC-type transport system permease component
MFVTILNILIAGLLMGGIYALIAMGLSLQYGVARVLNVSHGEFIMLGAFITWSLYSAFGINPLLSVAISGPFMFVIGFLIYRTLFAKLRTSSPSPAVSEGNSMLAAFGLLFILQNVACRQPPGNPCVCCRHRFSLPSLFSPYHPPGESTTHTFGSRYWWSHQFHRGS